MTPFRLRRKIFSSLVIILFIWFMGLKWFESQIPQSTSTIPENSADAIVALTGGNGRLEYALQLLAEHKANILFISGVGENVTIDDIIKQVQPGIRGKINPNEIIIGNKAENTIGNAEEIRNFWKTPITRKSYW